jgi:type IV secretory pathway VirB3-like protein
LTPDDDSSETRGEQVPPHETTPSPVDLSVATPRYFGVTPPTLLFGIASATLVLAIVFTVLERWIAGLVLAVAVLVEIGLFLSVARRKPDTRVAKASVRAIQRARERAGWVVQTTTVRTEVGRRLTPLRRDLLGLGEERERRLRELGAAVYEGDDETAKRITEEIRALDATKEQKEAEMSSIQEAARERLEREHLLVRPTIIKRPGEEE